MKNLCACDAIKPFETLCQILNVSYLHCVKFSKVSENFFPFFFPLLYAVVNSSFSFTNLTYRRLFGSQLIQSCAAPSSGAQYPPTVLGKAAPSSPFVVNPSPGPLLPLMTFRTNAEAVTMGERKPLSEREGFFFFF